MTLETFHLLAPRAQATFVLMRDTYLAHRWQKEALLMLYYLSDGARGFFIEVGYDVHHGRAVVLRSFTSSVLLEAYAHGVRLPEDL